MRDRPVHCRLSAFTLIEMVAAMALGVVLLVTIVSTFRAMTRVVAQVNVLSRENELLRAGWIAAVDDADFFHSEGNPDAPYGKGWTRQPLTAAAPSDKRHMARVLFDARTAPTDVYAGAATPSALRTDGATGLPILPNPNVLLPSDPRSWNRAPTVTNTRLSRYASPQVQCAGASISQAVSEQIYGAYRLLAATDMRDAALFPTGPDVGPGLAVTPWTTQTLPAMQAGLWQQLGYIGVAAYTRPGSPVNCLDQLGYLPAWYFPAGSGGSGSPSSPLPPFWGVAPASLQLNYLAADGTQMHVFLYHGLSQNWQAQMKTRVQTLLNGIQLKPVLGDDVGFKTANADATYAVVMGKAPTRADTYNQTQVDSIGDTARNPSFTSSTYRFPGNPTDVERIDTPAATRRIDLDGRPPEYPVMSTSILRLHEYMGASTMTYCRVVVRTPETGRILELPFAVLGTSLRGARQHWSRATSLSTATPAGDRYVP